MTISFVGSNVAANAIGADLPINLSLPASVEDDLVVLIWGEDVLDPNPPSTPGYTEIATASNPTALLRMQAFYKWMGATPDTSVSFPPPGGATRVQVVAALVFRGCFRLQPLDTPPVVVTGTTPVKAGAITPAHDDDLIIVAAVGIPADATVGSVSGFLPSPSVQSSKSSASQNVAGITVAASYQILSGGAHTPVTPGQWSTWPGAGPTLSRFIAFTITIREQAQATDTVPVTRASVVLAGKSVVVRETISVSKYRVIYTGNTVNVASTSELISVGKYNIKLTGKIVTATDVTGAVTVTQASVRYRGGIVDTRETTFEDVPSFIVKGRGSDVFMETR